MLMLNTHLVQCNAALISSNVPVAVVVCLTSEDLPESADADPCFNMGSLVKEDVPVMNVSGRRVYVEIGGGSVGPDKMRQ